jgi:hypothetical protein
MAERGFEHMGHQVFISYGAEKGDDTDSDHHAADRICSALEAENILCWIAHRDIAPGDNWLDAIIDAVEHSKIMVLVFSGNANQSQWVKDEVTFALDKNIKIIPFRIGDVSPEKGLKILQVRCQWIDAHNPPQQKELEKLVKAVCTHMERKGEELSEKSGYLRTVEAKAKRVYKNEQGFWEADYGDDIFIVYIPPGTFTMGPPLAASIWVSAFARIISNPFPSLEGSEIFTGDFLFFSVYPINPIFQTQYCQVAWGLPV